MGYENCAYPTTSINGGSYGTIFEIYQPGNIINVRISTIGEHGPTARELEPVFLEPDPILLLLLEGQPFMGHVSVPNVFSALRPAKRRRVAMWGWDTTPENLVGFRAVSLSVYQHASVELQGPFGVLAWRVL